MLTTAPPEHGGLLLVPGCSARHAGTVVVAAIDDDFGRRPVLAYAHEQADRQGVPLRVVHVWADRRRRITEADQLTFDSVTDRTPAEKAQAVERQIVHDADPARALITLSREAVLLVVAGRLDGTLGSTARRLAGHTCCPLAIVPAAPVIRGRW